MGKAIVKNGCGCLLVFLVIGVLAFLAAPEYMSRAPSSSVQPRNTATRTPESCYSGQRAWVASAMNIRAKPSVAANKVGVAQAGASFAVRDSRQGADYCWLKIDSGWIAKTAYVSASKPKLTQPKPAENVMPRDVQLVLAALDGLVVAPENRCSPYDSDDYPYPQSVEADIVRRMDGRIYGPYTGTTFGSTKETDIEHIVAKSEAHDSGLCGAGAQTRKSFARDLLNLTLASPSVNRHQKSGKDFAEWRPALNQCWFAHQIIKVKVKYGLTIDVQEKAALQQTLESCASVAMQ